MQDWGRHPLLNLVMTDNQYAGVCYCPRRSWSRRRQTNVLTYMRVLLCDNPVTASVRLSGEMNEMAALGGRLWWRSRALRTAVELIMLNNETHISRANSRVIHIPDSAALVLFLLFKLLSFVFDQMRGSLVIAIQTRWARNLYGSCNGPEYDVKYCGALYSTNENRS